MQGKKRRKGKCSQNIASVREKEKRGEMEDLLVMPGSGSIGTVVVESQP